MRVDPLIAVPATAAHFDEIDSGWENYVNPDTLDMGHFCTCVLGQRHGDYKAGKKVLRLTEDDAVILGLQIEFDRRTRAERLRRYAELTAAWRPEIERRRASLTAN